MGLWRWQGRRRSHELPHRRLSRAAGIVDNRDRTVGRRRRRTRWDACRSGRRRHRRRPGYRYRIGTPWRNGYGRARLRYCGSRRRRWLRLLYLVTLLSLRFRPSAVGGNLNALAAEGAYPPPSGLELLDVQFVPVRAVKADTHRYNYPDSLTCPDSPEGESQWLHYSCAWDRMGSDAPVRSGDLQSSLGSRLQAVFRAELPP